MIKVNYEFAKIISLPLINDFSIGGIMSRNPSDLSLRVGQLWSKHPSAPLLPLCIQTFSYTKLPTSYTCGPKPNQANTSIINIITIILALRGFHVAGT